MPKTRPKVKDPAHPTPEERAIPTMAMAVIANTVGAVTQSLGDPDSRLRAVDKAGKMLGEISLPANVAVREIGRDYVLGAYDDQDDLPHIVLFRLHRGR